MLDENESGDDCLAIATKFGDGDRVRADKGGDSGLGTSSGDAARFFG